MTASTINLIQIFGIKYLYFFLFFIILHIYIHWLTPLITASAVIAGHNQ